MPEIRWEPMAEITRSTVQHDTWIVTRIHGADPDDGVEPLEYDGVAAGLQRRIKAWVVDQLDWAEAERHRWVKLSEDKLELQMAWPT